MAVAFMLFASLVIELAIESACALAFGAARSAASLAITVATIYAGWRLVFFAIEFPVAQRLGEPVPSAYRPSAARWIATVLHEWVVSIVAFGVLQPFGPLLAPWAFRAPKAERSDRPVVLLIHGLFCNGAVWSVVRPALLRAGFDVHALNLPSVYGEIDTTVDAVHAQVERLCAARGVERILVVAHSMGGLVVRRYLAEHAGRRFAHVVTIGTPHAGTAMARFGRSPNVQDMRLQSRFLGALADRLADRRWTDFTCLYTWQDNLVVPQRTAVLPGARELAYSGVGHLAMLFDRRVGRDIVAILLEHSKSARSAIAIAEP